MKEIKRIKEETDEELGEEFDFTGCTDIDEKGGVSEDLIEGFWIRPDPNCNCFMCCIGGFEPSNNLY